MGARLGKFDLRGSESFLSLGCYGANGEHGGFFAAEFRFCWPRPVVKLISNCCFRRLRLATRICVFQLRCSSALKPVSTTLENLSWLPSFDNMSYLLVLVHPTFSIVICLVAMHGFYYQLLGMLIMHP